MRLPSPAALSSVALAASALLFAGVARADGALAPETGYHYGEIEPARTIALGEVSLSGELRRVPRLDARLREQMRLQAEQEREAMLVEVKPTEEEVKEEAPKEEEKKPEVPIEAPKQEQKTAEDKQDERKVDALKELKGEEREEAKRDMVANRLAAETAKVDEALKALDSANATRMFAVSDDAAGAQAGNSGGVIADPTGALAKEMAGGGKIGRAAQRAGCYGRALGVEGHGRVIRRRPPARQARCARGRAW